MDVDVGCIYDAAIEDDQAFVKEVLNMKLCLDYSLPLYKAASKGHLEIVRLFLTQDLDHRSLVEALLKAVKEGHVDIIKLIKEKLKGCKVMDMVNQQALITAARRGNCTVVKFLLAEHKQGAELALIEAARKGHLKVVKLLAPSNMNTDALHMASKYDHWDVYDYLYRTRRTMKTIKRSANDRKLLRASELGDVDMVKVLLSRKVNEYCEPLVMAVFKGHLEVVRELITFGVVVYDYVLYSAASKGYFEILKVMVDKYHLNRLYNEDEQRQCFARLIVLAVKGSHTKVVKYLLEHRKVVCYDCEPALIKATKKGNLKLVKLLLNTVNVDPQRSIGIATRKGYNEILLTLKKKDRKELPEDPYADIISDTDSDTDNKEGCGYSDESDS